MTHEEYMSLALQLAEKGAKTTAPNPMVGAVVVKNGTIIGKGYHQYPGGPHAEVYALEEAGREAKGATLYVTLEPCSHFGRTPPCVDRLIEAGIAEVYIGSLDPNPLVNGKGLSKLKEAGIPYHIGILEEKCESLNEVFLTTMREKIPFVTAKMAMSLDGNIATKTGESQWITNKEARKFGHGLRAENEAIIVGIGTVLADNPTLNCRIPCERQPDCIILDSWGRTPPEASIFSVTERKVLIYVSSDCPKARREALKEKGAQVIVISSGLDANHTSIRTVLEDLYQRGYRKVLIEGGSTVLGAAVDAHCVHKIWTYIGNIIIGGAAHSAILGEGVAKLKDATTLTFTSVELHENNVYICSSVRRR